MGFESSFSGEGASQRVCEPAQTEGRRGFRPWPSARKDGREANRTHTYVRCAKVTTATRYTNRRLFCDGQIKPKSDTPRGAGGLMSWAASKAVGAFI
jgi:hypothetical protein